MSILKSLGLGNKDKGKEKQEQNPSAQNPKQNDPHRHGGCCGSCGGQGQKQEQK